MYSYFEPMNLFSFGEILFSFQRLYEASFGILQVLQLSIFNIAETFFTPEVFTGQSWCFMGEVFGLSTSTNFRLMPTNIESPRDLGAKVATSIVADRLLTNWFLNDDPKYNFSTCDGRVEYIGISEIGTKLSNCKESIFVSDPEIEHIRIERLAQFALLAKDHVFLEPFFLATLASRLSFYVALYLFLSGRFLLRVIFTTLRRFAHIPRVNTQYIETHFVGLSIFVSLATGFLLLYLSQFVYVLWQ
jgi:hypothetical protein